ncbi:hypothetical protein HMPREF0623_1413 [Pediococcus acidilactici DSM 20284]|uniref:Uncharacterized protein n=1 Tax=Pediococcus acidilactici DSM 20284 TaxID=862514 RepID=E0NH90_PEDAC|nr:hypothetical protein HMPREF0623_1413 [Pediococcus acidilactici DSM 20284]
MAYVLALLKPISQNDLLTLSAFSVQKANFLATCSWTQFPPVNKIPPPIA